MDYIVYYKDYYNESYCDLCTGVVELSLLLKQLQSDKVDVDKDTIEIITKK